MLGNGLYVLGNGPHGLGNGPLVLGNGPHLLGIISHLVLCRIRGYVVWHYVVLHYVAFGIQYVAFGLMSFGYVSFGVMSFGLLLVYYILVVWSVYIILRIYCTVQYSMYCNWYIVNIKYWNLVKNYYFKMKTCQSGKFICIIIFFSNLQILSKTRKQVQCLHRFHENCRK